MPKRVVSAAESFSAAKQYLDRILHSADELAGELRCLLKPTYPFNATFLKVNCDFLQWILKPLAAVTGEIDFTAMEGYGVEPITLLSFFGGSVLNRDIQHSTRRLMRLSGDLQKDVLPSQARPSQEFVDGWCSATELLRGAIKKVVQYDMKKLIAPTFTPTPGRPEDGHVNTSKRTGHAQAKGGKGDRLLSFLDTEAEREFHLRVHAERDLERRRHSGKERATIEEYAARGMTRSGLHMNARREEWRAHLRNFLKIERDALFHVVVARSIALQKADVEAIKTHLHKIAERVSEGLRPEFDKLKGRLRYEEGPIDTFKRAIAGVAYQEIDSAVELQAIEVNRNLAERGEAQAQETYDPDAYMPVKDALDEWGDGKDHNAFRKARKNNPWMRFDPNAPNSRPRVHRADWAKFLKGPVSPDTFELLNEGDYPSVASDEITHEFLADCQARKEKIRNTKRRTGK